MTTAGLSPDEWQTELIRSGHGRILVVCSRQSGKSESAAALALKTALLEPPCNILIISRSLRQSVELFRKVRQLYQALASGGNSRSKWNPRPVRHLEQESRLPVTLGNGERLLSDNAMSMELANGSRIISLPCSPDTIVGFSSIRLLIIDEAARVPDALYKYLRPMLAVLRGQLVCISTPKGKRGWFWDENHRYEESLRRGEATPWHRIRVTADRCPRLSPAFLEEERESLGERWYLQEYFAEFYEAEDAVFREEDIQASLSNTETWDQDFLP